MPSSKLALSLFLGVLALAFLAACSGDGDGPEETATPAATAPPTSTPDPGGATGSSTSSTPAPTTPPATATQAPTDTPTPSVEEFGIIIDRQGDAFLDDAAAILATTFGRGAHLTTGPGAESGMDFSTRDVESCRSRFSTHVVVRPAENVAVLWIPPDQGTGRTSCTLSDEAGVVYLLCSDPAGAVCLGEIEPAGTSFAVSRYRGGWTVRVLDGSVTVRTPSEEIRVPARMSENVQDGLDQLSEPAAIASLAQVESETLDALDLPIFAPPRPAQTVLDAVEEVSVPGPDSFEALLIVRDDLLFFDQEAGVTRPLVADDLVAALNDQGGELMDGLFPEAVDDLTVLVIFADPRSEARMLEALDSIPLQFEEP